MYIQKGLKAKGGRPLGQIGGQIAWAIVNNAALGVVPEDTTPFQCRFPAMAWPAYALEGAKGECPCAQVSPGHDMVYMLGQRHPTL